MRNWIVADTDVMIDFLRGHAAATSFVLQNGSVLCLPAMVVAELYAGVRGEVEEKKLDDLVSALRFIPVSLDISKRAAQLKREYGKSHGVGLADALVAASTELEGGTLATLNVRHYPMFRNLAAPYIKL